MNYKFLVIGTIMEKKGDTSNNEVSQAVFLSWAKYLWTELK